MKNVKALLAMQIEWMLQESILLMLLESHTQITFAASCRKHRRLKDVPEKIRNSEKLMIILSGSWPMP